MVTTNIPFSSAWISHSAQTCRGVKYGMNYQNSELFMSGDTNKESVISTKESVERMLNIMEEEGMASVSPGDIIDDSEVDTDILDLVHTIVKAADGRKADDITALYVRPITTLTSFMVILSGNSRPQNQAITAAILDDVEEEHALKPAGDGVPEGTAESGWMVLDYGSVMVHIMTPKSRLYYNMDGQWEAKGGRSIDISKIIIPNAPGSLDSDAVDSVQEEDDPFWS